MDRVAILASPVTLPGSPTRRVDSFEHDHTMAAYRAAFPAEGLEPVDVSWDDAEVDWSGFSAAVVATTWDYWDRHADFLAALARIEAATRLFNPAALVQWNTDKRYLAELEARGARCIPTAWLPEASPEAVAEAFEALGADDLVIKRQVGAGAFEQVRLRRGEPVPAMPRPMFAQPFLPAIQSEGELSFVVIDGEVSHALVKRAAAGDYRIQSMYGGTEEILEASAEDRAVAEGVVGLLEEVPLYARVDLVRADDGGLLLMELEMVEPYLYPLQGPELGPRMAAALARRLR